MKMKLVALFLLPLSLHAGYWDHLLKGADKDVRRTASTALDVAMDMSMCEENVYLRQFVGPSGTGSRIKNVLWHVLQHNEWVMLPDGSGAVFKPVETFVVWSDEELPCLIWQSQVRDYVRDHPDHHVIVFDYVWGHKEPKTSTVSPWFLAEVLKRVLEAGP